jgi:hypothetical protein
MSKKLTLKKGLAFGTVIAFGTTLIAAAPAMAAPSLSLVPAYGSGYSSLNNYYSDDWDSSQIFVLKSNFVDEPMGKNVIYKIENAGESAIKYNVDDSVYDAAGPVWDEDGYDGDDNSDVFYIDESPDTDLTSYLALSTWDLDSDVSIKVTAFYDVNENGMLDAEEGAADVASATRTITWYTPANSKPQAALNQPAWGDTSLTTVVTFGVDGMNTEMMDGVLNEVEDYMEYGLDTQVYVNTERRAPTGSYSFLDDNATYWDSEDKLFVSEDSLGGAVQIGTYRSQVWVGDWDNDDDTGSAWSSKVVAEPKADDVDLSAVTGPNVTSSPDDGDFDYGVRAGTTSVGFEATAYLDGDEIGAGVPVTITISDDGLETGSSVTAGGKTLKAGGDDIKFSVNTNAAGVATFTVTSAKAAADDEIEVTAKVDDVDGGIATDNEYVIWEKAVVNDIVETSAIDYDYYTSRSIVKGGAYTLDYLVLDQFDEPTSTDGGKPLRVVLSDNDADNTITANKAVSDGRVSFSITDASKSVVSDYEVEARVWKDNGTSLTDMGDNWDTKIFVNEKASAGEFFDINIYGSGDGANDTGDLTASQLADSDFYDLADVYGDVEYEDFVTGSHWKNVDFGDLGNLGGDLDIGLYVADSDGNIQPGAPVTVSAPGLLIQDYEYSDQASLGTYTAPADDSAWFEIYLYSHKSGVFPVTITSGTAKITFNVAFYVDNDDVADDEVKMSMSNTPTWGKGSIDVKATITDKFGNGLSDQTVDFTKTGLGFLDETSADTDSNGIARVTLVGGTAGSTTVSAKSDDSFDAVSASSLLRWWNKTASATEGVKAGRVLVYGIAAAGDRVVVRVDGKKVAAYTTTTGRFSYVAKGIASGDKNVVVRINKKKVFADVLSVN